MARKPKPRKNPIVNKEYVWELEVDGSLHSYKVFVGEDECVTYEDDVECKRLKIMDKTQMEGLLQIDCKTKIFDDSHVPFQLENGIPYIMVDDDDGKPRWTMSDTTREDRLQEQVVQVKKRAYGMIAMGFIFMLWCAVQYFIEGTLGEWPAAPMLAIFCFTAGGVNFIQLKNELSAMGRHFSMKLDVKA